MKNLKKYLLTGTICLSQLCSCGNVDDSISSSNDNLSTNSQESVNTFDEQSEEASLLSEKIEESVNTSDAQSEEASSLSEKVEESESDVKMEGILNVSEIKTAVNKRFNVKNHLSDAYKDTWLIEMGEVIDNEIIPMDDPRATLAFDENDNVIGKKEGTSKIRIFLDGNEESYEDVTVEVLPFNDWYKLPCDEYTFKDKNVVVFGDSISDNSVTAYPNNRPDFWVEKLSNQLGAKQVYNYAYSGSTVGYSKPLANRGVPLISGTKRVNDAKEDIKKCDYAFIFFGANDYDLKETLGVKGEINDSNYARTESFLGAYYYVIEKILKQNPDIEIILLSCTRSDWGFVDNYDNKNYYAQTRDELNSVIEGIAADVKAKYIHLYEAWSQDEVKVYCPDGIHPQSNGYQKIIDTIIGKI